ncbi:MAG: hypothetical protein WD845_12155 [Pirellulales bacterium]
MKCLSQTELFEALWDEATGEQVAVHLAECVACRAALADMRTLDANLAAAHRPYSLAHEAGRERLLAALEHLDPPRVRVGLGWTPNRWMGGLTVAQRTAIGGVALAALLAGVLLWVGSPAPRASAMERMAENVRRAKSYEVTMDMEVALPGGKGSWSEGTSKLYWLAPGSMRSDEKGTPGTSMASLNSTLIQPARKPGVRIDHTRRVYWREPEQLGKPLPLSMVEGFGHFAGQADRELGAKEIDSKQARGFEIAIEKVDPDAFEGTLEIWIDEATDLPVLVRISPQLSPPSVLTLHDFRWNVEFDPKLFDTTPPAGYKDATPAELTLDERVDWFRQGLATFAELSGGHYPRVEIIYGDVTLDEMKRLARFDSPPTPEQVRTDEYVKIQRAVRSFAMLNSLFRENPDMAYYGRTVDARDKDKVLLRWQLDDGRHQVMYGDLRSETVSPERLRELEAK